MPFLLVDNAALQVIRDQWDAQCKASGGTLEEFAPPAMEHAEGIVKNGSNSRDYSIFSAVVEGNHECILHVNRARLPQTNGITQRVMWILLAPKYDDPNLNVENIANIAKEVVLGAIDLCFSEGTSSHIKIYLGNLADRSFFEGVALTLRSTDKLQEIAIRGNWLHMSIA